MWFDYSLLLVLYASKHILIVSVTTWSPRPASLTEPDVRFWWQAADWLQAFMLNTYITDAYSEMIHTEVYVAAFRV